MMPWATSMAQWAREPRTSCLARRWSKSMEELISSMMAVGPAEKRPPHILLVIVNLKDGSTSGPILTFASRFAGLYCECQNQRDIRFSVLRPGLKRMSNPLHLAVFPARPMLAQTEGRVYA